MAKATDKRRNHTEKGGGRGVSTRFLNGGFVVLALVNLAALLHSEGSLANVAITTALLAALWYAAEGVARPVELFAAWVLLLLQAAGVEWNLYTVAIAGVTFDTYLHLIAAFVTTMLLARLFETRGRKDALLLAAAAVLVLGVGVEIVEILDQILKGGATLRCTASGCHYWLDMAKDLVNDTLGVLAFTLGRISGRR